MPITFLVLAMVIGAVLADIAFFLQRRSGGKNAFKMVGVMFSLAATLCFVWIAVGGITYPKQDRNIDHLSDSHFGIKGWLMISYY